MSFGDLSRVNTNVGSIASRFQLNKVNSELADTQTRLSTGLRINKAEDDSAGFSIASKLRGRITGLEQALSNVGDAKSVLDIAESGINTVMDTLIEMKGLATQAANDTLGATERAFIGDQIAALAQDINTVSDQTSYQGTNLLEGDGVDSASSAANGTGTTSLTFQVGEAQSDTQSVSLSAISANSLFSGILDSGNAIDLKNTDSTTGATSDAKGTLVVTSATASDFNAFIGTIDTAIDSVSSVVNQIGIDQSSLSTRQENLTAAITSNSSAKSRTV